MHALFMRGTIAIAVLILAGPVSGQQSATPGQDLFELHCSVCHGTDGLGGELGPPIVGRARRRTDADLATVIAEGLPTRGMPPIKLHPGEASQIISYLRTLKFERARPPERVNIETTEGRKLSGFALNQTAVDLQLRSDDGNLHLLRVEGSKYREVTSQTDWATYNGDPRGNRLSPLRQIKRSNVARLAPRWMFTMPNVTAQSETTPVVAGGVMYVTSANECWALDAGSGREIWHFQRPRTKGLTGNGAGGYNRGVAAAGDRAFMVTDNAHVIALNRFTGELIWEKEMADWHLNYSATSAPLVAGDLVLAGTAGGENGARGFLAAYRISDGSEAWRFWTVPKPGEPGAETWGGGKGLEHPSGVTWFTGSYDPELDTVYWQTGNPGPDYNGADRPGDNLYSDCILALDRRTGRLKWYYQTTPHDEHDWDATEPVLLVDARWKGAQRKLLLQANRNGFFYAIDRVKGTLLLATPFVRKLNWASGIGADGKPIRKVLPTLKAGSTKVCPSQDGATNWYSAAYLPQTGLFYVQSLEKCDLYSKREAEWQAGRSYLGGGSRNLPGETPQKVFRALDIQSGAIRWEIPQKGMAGSWGGALATASGLVFFGEDSGMFEAVDGATGQVLWRFQTNQNWRASPMSYEFDGQQYVAVTAGATILSFGLIPE
ncbi:MAG TPA: PQQ-binding-like beta-propeller repeat protein [Bryobacteraceae bacterium]|nr:PQQ-binding-like beta-propeller repeat protein [Bryobacteraceae bacterium]